ncbi:pyruvate, phosphate dikinase [Amylibacter marinus]|nr:pyruvate, phosphate dikinase [Amylibacter marinus]
MDGTQETYPDCVALSATAEVPVSVYGARAAAAVELLRANLPIPNGWAFAADTVRKFGRGEFPESWPVSTALKNGVMVSLRVSPINRDWGGPETLLNIGMNAARHKDLIDTLGQEAADAFYLRFVQGFAINVARLDAEDFDAILDRSKTDAGTDSATALAHSLAYYESEMDMPFPQDPEDQLRQALRSMANAWNGASGRILRAARGAPADAGLGLLVQEMVLGIGKGEFGSGIAQFVSPTTGTVNLSGRYLGQSQGRDAMDTTKTAQYLAQDKRGPSLEEACPESFMLLQRYGAQVREIYRDEMQVEFTVEDGQVWLLDATPAERNVRAAIAIAVNLVELGLISRDQALARVAPRNLSEVLHAQIDPKAAPKQLAMGIGASPGAASGKIVFSSPAAVAAQARGEASILVRVETSPDDIRGMHSANAILTERGGINSHAAVVARTLGLPCVVSAEDISVDKRSKTITLPDGQTLKEGTVITLDGSTGQIFWGAAGLVEPKFDGPFRQFLAWADEVREMGVRCNADTPQDVRMALAFGSDGIGLVRTEHMFYDPGRLTVMRELIFADKAEDRIDALNLLLPMQRGDFQEIFALMNGAQVCIRLLDPPLHEFLPTTRAQQKALADAMGIPSSKVSARIEELSEFNPMLGMRGVRLGITVPEIYDMQARAIFEAALEFTNATGRSITPEIMVPLVSANHEVELVKSRIDAIASAVQSERGVALDYKLGVMVETPRAALRARDIARSCEFMSFGTNDLTQMTYGLSRDDAGRFMREYVNLNVFPEDPFRSLDVDGVGELLLMAAERGRADKPDLLLGLCGEHGGDPESVKFCAEAGFDYVSCSPFSTPIARLAAAQAQLLKNVAKK